MASSSGNAADGTLMITTSYYSPTAPKRYLTLNIHSFVIVLGSVAAAILFGGGVYYFYSRKTLDAAYEQLLNEKDARLMEKDALLLEKDARLIEKEHLLAIIEEQLNTSIVLYHQLLDEKEKQEDALLKEMKTRLTEKEKEKNALLKEMDARLMEKERLLAKIEEQLKTTHQEKEHYMERLHSRGPQQDMVKNGALKQACMTQWTYMFLLVLAVRVHRCYLE